MECSADFGSFVINTDTLRFIATYTVGFIDSRKDEEQKVGNSPSISIGSCSPL